MTDATAGGSTGVGDMAHRVGEDLSDLMQNEVQAAKDDLASTAKEGAAGAGMVGGAAVAGAMALLFGSIAVWCGLGNHIGFGRSAALVALLYGGAAAVLSSKGGQQLVQVKARIS
jgi:hypothetical protein